MNDREPVQLPSDRRFGLLFAAIFAGLAAYNLFVGGGKGAVLACAVVAVVMALLAFIAPRRLASLNRAWFKLGEWLGKLVNPLVLGVIFFGLLTPIAFVSRLFGRDELRLKPRPVESYWIERTPPGPAPDSFKNQF